MRTARGLVRASNQLFNPQPVKSRILRVELNPLLSGKGLAAVHEQTCEVWVEIHLQIRPAMLVNRAHQVA